jgi:hypothetical protein
MNRSDRRTGMNRTITRRDFLNGIMNIKINRTVVGRKTVYPKERT